MEDKLITSEIDNLDSFPKWQKLFAVAMRRIDILNPNDANSRLQSRGKYTREQIMKWLASPEKNSKNLIDASAHLYNTMTLYRRICSYLATLPTFDYVIMPMSTGKKSSQKKVLAAYQKVCFDFDIMHIKQLCENILKTVVRDGVYYGIELSQENSYTIWQAPAEYCKVIGWEDACPCFAMDMRFFDKLENKILLEALPNFIMQGYQTYKEDGANARWAIMPSDQTVCILADETMEYVIPPLAGCFPDLYVIDEYKDLVQAKSIIDIYKLLSLKIPTNDKGELSIDDGIASRYANQIQEQLPEQIGCAATPFTIDSVSFDKNTSDIDMTSRAERDLFSSLGISQMVMSNESETSTAMKYSVMNDYAFVLPVVHSIERWLCKKLKQRKGAQRGEVLFQMSFVDVNRYTADSTADKLIKGMQYGVPNKLEYCAVAMGLTPNQVLSENYLETEVLQLQDTFIPPKSANTASSSDNGRPASDDSDLTAEGNRAREKGGKSDE